MNKNQLLKPVTLLPILIGVATGAMLFWIGYAEDAPGMCVLGLAIAFVLILLGIRNAGIVKKEYFLPIILLCFGLGGIVLSIVLLLDGEFGESPGLAAIGIALGVAMICMAILLLRKRKPV